VSRRRVVFAFGFFVSYVPFFKVGIEAYIFIFYNLCLAYRTIFYITLYFVITSYIRSLKSVCLAFARIRPFKACFRTNIC
jgi:hypothetical protein